MGEGGHRPDRYVQVVPSVHHPGIPEIAGVGEQAVGEPVVPPIGHRIGPGRRSEERQTDHAARNVVAVLGVVEQGHPVSRLGQISPPVCADLKTGDVPAGVGVGGPFHVAELDFVGGAEASHGDGKGHLEQPIGLVPFDFGVELDPTRSRVEADDLGQERVPNRRLTRMPARNGPCSSRSIASTWSRSTTWSKANRSMSQAS